MSGPNCAESATPNLPSGRARLLITWRAILAEADGAPASNQSIPKDSRSPTQSRAQGRT
jgi:hypothetical protein